MIGYIIIGADLLIVLSLFCMLQFQKWNQDKISQEIDDAEVTASDFTVEIRNLPKIPPELNILEFKSEMWKWIESLIGD
jgi:hypothetical protein